MLVNFHKYQGTGNDFILVDNRKPRINISINSNKIAKLCNRKFGIGADGLILLQSLSGYDFEMIYYNADGKESSMCGNGGRCIVAFAKRLGIVQKEALFVAVDGEHKAIIEKDSVKLKMKDVESIEEMGDYIVLNTGSPHLILYVEDIKNLDVLYEGKKIRYSEPYKKEGINVNFVSYTDSTLFVRTYERGVENETLSCGTGVVAAALSAAYKGILPNSDFVRIITPGGKLSVNFNKKSKPHYTDIWLEGPADFVFKGEIEIA